MHDLHEIHRRRMEMALGQAQAAYDADEVPVGAVIFAGEELVAKAHNLREKLQDPTAHAEILAITQAAAALGSWRLEGCAMYVTLEPCAMCAGALVLARCDQLIFGAWDAKAGACGSVLNILECEQLNHTVEVTAGVLEAECGHILSTFFQEKREGLDRLKHPE